MKKGDAETGNEKTRPIEIMEQKQIDLYEFLIESELQHYYNAIKNELKISNTSQFKYATDEDLKQIGLSRPEIRRLRKFYEKYYSHGYISKLKKFLQAPTTRREETFSAAPTPAVELTKPVESPKNIPNNKHIIPTDSISVHKQLGVGEFGIVQQGVWTNGTERIQVAIKCLSRERMQSNPMEFLKEASIMHSIEHENIVRLHGVVLAADSLMLVTELAHLRSLLECLKDSGLRVSFLTVPTLCEFATQICNGMMYLENKRLIHRDLAARNILVFSKNKVKISDFGLSRALGVGKDYYKTNFNVNLKLPIAWCAPECINYLRFTNSSDVWAFGVCLWEMFSYGFQPWAALTGLQILEAIDEPNYQRLEQPECCPQEYYNLMQKCWQHEPTKRPKFSDIYTMLPDIKPEQLKAVVNTNEPKKDYLRYRQGEIITVLERTPNSPTWKGVLNSGKTGVFNPANTVAYLEGLPSLNRETFVRGSDRYSKRKLRTEMISKPQDDFKHTGHIGIDGVSFGNISFLSNPQNCNHVPRQIVTPYKPSEDIEQTPLLPPTPTSPDSLQTASGYFSEENPTSSTNPTFINSIEDTTHKTNSTISYAPFNFESRITHNSLNPFTSDATNGAASAEHQAFSNRASYGAFANANMNDEAIQAQANQKDSWPATRTDQDAQHEYHEISDDDITTENVIDLGPSLLDEINSMFGSMSAASNDYSTKRIDSNDVNSKSLRKGSYETNTNKSKKKAAGTVKPISVKDEKMLNHAIEIANEISARSMTDLVSDHAGAAPSPKRKFSFRFPQLATQSSTEKDACNLATGGAQAVAQPKEKKKFCEELKSIPDLQGSITEEGKLAYDSLIERKCLTLSSKLDSKEFYLTNTKTLPRRLVSDNGLDKSLAEKGECDNVFKNGGRHMTLPSRYNKSKSIGFSLNCNENAENIDANSSICESPSYLLNTSYNFPEKGIVRDGDLNQQPTELNVIPLPPRDRNKVIKTNPKRHIRKHPLIIPAYGVQRTLNIVTGVSPVDDEKEAGFGRRSVAGDSMEKVTQEPIKALTIEKEQTANRNNYSLTTHSNCRIYENMQDLSTDSASLQFESILEDASNKVNMLSSPDVIDGFCPFIQKDVYIKPTFKTQITELHVNDDELRNLDIEKKKIKCFPPQGGEELEAEKDVELCGNLKLNDCNSVSCEDLLEISNKKPKGSERGFDSDEVRIMIKVLGKVCPPERCLTVLEFIDWDVHRAIKIVRLQNIVSPAEISLTECADSLKTYDWDLQMTAVKLKGLK